MPIYCPVEITLKAVEIGKSSSTVDNNGMYSQLIFTAQFLPMGQQGGKCLPIFSAYSTH